MRDFEWEGKRRRILKIKLKGIIKIITNKTYQTMEPIVHYPSLERAFNLANRFVLIDLEHRNKFSSSAIFSGDTTKIVIEKSEYDKYMNEQYDAEINY